MALSQATVAGLKGKDFNVLCDEFPDELLITLQWMQQRLLSYQLGECIDENAFWKNLNEDAKDELAGLFCTMLIPAGQTLFNEGEQGHGLYLILSGRVQLTNQSDTPSNMGKHRNQTLAIFGKGDMLGEMALLTSTPRSGTARTLRDTQLAYLSRVAFEGILDKYPRQVLSASVHQIAERLRVRNRFGGQDFKLPAVITVLSRAKDCPLFTDELVAALSQLAPTKSVAKRYLSENHKGAPVAPRSGREVTSLAQRSGEPAQPYGAAGSPEDEAWAFRCFRQSDVVLIVADNDTDIPQLAEQLEKWKRMIGRTPMCHLVLLHHASVSLPTNTRKRLSGIKVERHWHVRMGSDDASRIARFLSGKSVGLVMGGGFALGLAHIGVAQALRDLKVPIDFVGGTSMGGDRRCGMCPQPFPARDAGAAHQGLCGFVQGRLHTPNRLHLVRQEGGRRIGSLLRWRRHRRYVDSLLRNLSEPDSHKDGCSQDRRCPSGYIGKLTSSRHLSAIGMGR